jgi:arginine decarboxylase
MLGACCQPESTVGSQLVARVNRSLLSDSYRNTEGSDGVAEPEPFETDQGTRDDGRSNRPYFEVLIVDDMTEAQARALRDDLRQLRRPDDPFVYEPVVVPSFDDAVNAVLSNFNLQACVVRRRFAHRSRYDLSALGSFVNNGGDVVPGQLFSDEILTFMRSLDTPEVHGLRPDLGYRVFAHEAIERAAGQLL